VDDDDVVDAVDVDDGTTGGGGVADYRMVVAVVGANSGWCWRVHLLLPGEEQEDRSSRSKIGPGTMMIGAAVDEEGGSRHYST
jgi:hypothetical protein